MVDLSGVPPERLPPAEDIRKVRTAIKSTGKEYAKLDAVQSLNGKRPAG
jgi:hypothetical protein